MKKRHSIDGSSGKTSKTASIVLAMAISAALALAVIPDDPESSYRSLDRVQMSSLVPHSPVVINSDADFVAQGWPGAGTEEEPYLIADLEVDATGYRAAIFVGNVTANFTISGCSAYGATDAGIQVFRSVNGTVVNNTCEDNLWYSVVCYECKRLDILNNTCRGPGGGIHLSGSDDCSINGNDCSELAGTGIQLVSSDNNTVSSNCCCGNGETGIYLEFSQFNSIQCNTCIGNFDGISITQYSHACSLIGNNCSNNHGSGVRVVSSHDVTAMDGISIGNMAVAEAGRGLYAQLSNGLTVLDYSASDNQGDGIHLYDCDDALLADNVCNRNLGYYTVSKNDEGNGIYADSCLRLALSNNTCEDNFGHGIELWRVSEGVVDNCSGSHSHRWGGGSFSSFSLRVESSSDVEVRNGLYCDSVYGVYLQSVRNVLASGCLIEGNEYMGMRIGMCERMTLTGCQFHSNDYLDVWIASSTGVIMRDNTMTGYGLSFSGTSISHWTYHDIDTSNQVDGRPVVYLKNASSGTVIAGASQVILAGCSGVTVEGQSISGVDTGIQMGYSSGNTIRNNTCSLSRYGIYLMDSNSNSIFWNGIAHNTEVGLKIYGAANVIWNNSFVGNRIQAEDRLADKNKWNISGIGNHWSDWTSPDLNLDNIVDFPYVLSSGSTDYYPLTNEPPGIPEWGPLGVSVMSSLILVAIVVIKRMKPC